MREQGLDLRSQQQPRRRLGVVQRLLTRPVARGHECPVTPIPERQREHPAETREELLSVLFVGVHQHFHVRP